MEMDFFFEKQTHLHTQGRGKGMEMDFELTTKIFYYL